MPEKHLPMSESVVLVPGLQSDGTSWLSFYKRFAQRHPVTIPMGHQRADTIAEMGRRVIEQSPARFHLVGWSMGGYVAFEILRRWPERLLSLTLIATTAEPESPQSLVRRQEALALARAEGMRSYQAKNLRNCLHDPDALDAEMLEAILQSSEALGVEAFEAQTMAIIARPDARDDLAACPCPAMIIVGRNDAIIPPDKSRDMHALLPRSRFVEMDDCGHCPPMERPDELFHLLIDWFSAVEAAPDAKGSIRLREHAPLP